VLPTNIAQDHHNQGYLGKIGLWSWLGYDTYNSSELRANFADVDQAPIEEGEDQSGVNEEVHSDVGHR